MEKSIEKSLKISEALFFPLPCTAHNQRKFILKTLSLSVFSRSCFFYFLWMINKLIFLYLEGIIYHSGKLYKTIGTACTYGFVHLLLLIKVKRLKRHSFFFFFFRLEFFFAIFKLTIHKILFCFLKISFKLYKGSFIFRNIMEVCDKCIETNFD